MELHRSKFSKIYHLTSYFEHFETNRLTYRLVNVTEAMAARLLLENAPEIYKLYIALQPVV